MARLKVELTRQEIEAACVNAARERYGTALKDHELVNVTFIADLATLDKVEITFTSEPRPNPQR